MNNRELYYLMFSLKKPSDEYSLKGMDVIKEIFVKLTDKNENEVGHSRHFAEQARKSSQLPGMTI